MSAEDDRLEDEAYALNARFDEWVDAFAGSGALPRRIILGADQPITTLRLDDEDNARMAALDVALAHRYREQVYAYAQGVRAAYGVADWAHPGTPPVREPGPVSQHMTGTRLHEAMERFHASGTDVASRPTHVPVVPPADQPLP